MAEKTIAQQLADAQAQITTLNGTVATLTKERDQALAANQSAVELAVGPLNQQIATLTQERDQAKTDLTATQATIATKDGEIAKLQKDAKTAGQKAAEIAASQSTPAVGESAEKKEAAETAEELREQLKTERDPVARAGIARKLNALRKAKK